MSRSVFMGGGVDLQSSPWEASGGEHWRGDWEDTESPVVSVPFPGLGNGLAVFGQN